MNHSRNAIDQAEIDRLVDGELSPAARRELLMRFDAGVDDWSRLALAFVEAQAWQQQFREIRQGITVANAPVSRPPQTRPSPARSRWLAVTILLASGVGFGLGSTWPLSRPTPLSISNGTDVPSQPGNGVPAAAVPHDAVQPDAPVETVRFVLDEVTGAEAFDLPLVHVGDLDPEWLEPNQPIVPKPVRQFLEQTGHRIDAQRRFYPVRLRDGRNVVVPVDDVEVRFVGHQAFQ